MRWCSGFQGRADQAEELVVSDGGRVPRAQLDGSLAGPQLGMTFGKAAVTALPPAVDRDPVLPRADVETAAADLVGGDSVRQDHGRVGVGDEDQPVDAVEQGTMRGVDAVDVTLYRFVHCPIVTVRGLLQLVGSSWHGILLRTISGLYRQGRLSRPEIIAP